MKKALALLLAATLGMSTLAACGNSGSTQTQDPAVDESGTTQETETQVDVWEKYEPAIDVSVVGSYNVPEDGAVPKDTTLENQAWVEIAKEYMGINLKYDWAVPASQGAQKLDVTIASGQIPDVLMVDEAQFELMKESDMLGDLSEAYKQLLEPIRKMLEEDPTLLKQCTNAKGELVAIPYILNSYQQSQLIYIREDWLEKLNLSVPQSMDELIEVARKFTTEDPDGNGKDDTTGIALYKELYAGYGGAKGLMNGFGAYPNMWVKGEDGKLVCGDVTPQMRDALLAIQEMYKEGIIDPEYVALDSDKMTEAVVSGQVGIVLGEWWVPAWPLNMTIDNNPDARWKAINLVSSEGGVAKTGLNHAFIGAYNVISKDMENPEALAKLLNLYYDVWASTNPEYKSQIDPELLKPENRFVYNWFPVRMENCYAAFERYEKVNAALEAGTSDSLTDPAHIKIYEQCKNLETNFNGTDWGAYCSRIAKDGGIGLSDKVRSEELYVMNEFYGSFTESMKMYQGVLDSKRDEIYHRVITGAPIEEFDKFVEDWYSMGGQDITDEVNAWYEAQQ